MRSVAFVLLLGILLPASLPGQMQDPEIGAPAPAFALPDTYGSQHSLSDYAGKWVVLEWLNYDCPFVRKHYDSGNMQGLQQEYGEQGVIWFSVVSSAPGKQGYFEPDEMNALSTEKGNAANAVLMDPDGVVGMAYGAKTTPQMYVINPDGVLLYNGAIDDRPSARPESLEGATNYLAQALTEAMAGQAVSQPTSQPYGCSVKYKD
ncbi:thioredoxin family protein [Gemmatimonadota bacterium]